jgi:hypothetical protein
MKAAPLALALLLLATPPRLPEGVKPLPRKSAEHVDELLRKAEEYRGLKARQPVAAGTVDPRRLKEKVAGSIAEDYTPDELRSLETSLKAFGLVPESLDLRRYLPELLSSQVAGFYDPVRKYLALVRPDKKMPAGADDTILVHELTHALQDQHFDLHRFEGGDPMSDAGTALTALIEGDATLVMLDFQMGGRAEAIPGTEEAMGRMLNEPEKLIAASAGFPGAREIAEAPAWLRDTLLFSYFQGSAFCVSARRRGGQPLLDYAYTTDPPRSTEQILHPDKWHTRRDDPVFLQLPDLSGELPGYRRTAEGVMGELSLRIFLREGLREKGLQAGAEAAAAGWGGDRFAVYEKDGGRLVAWVTDWDSEADAVELRNALMELKEWRVEAAGPRRVVALRGSLPPERWEAVRARLAAAVATRPANQEIDLQAIGAVPTPLGPAAPSPSDGR